MIGIFLSNDNIMGKKFPNRLSIPNTSTIIPIIGHPINTRVIPPRKQAVPLNLEGRLKKIRVFLNPINRVIPSKNNRLPNASNALSKNNKQPNTRKKEPKPVKPAPIFRLSENISPNILYDE